MWQSKTLSGSLEITLQSESGYTPPEKKLKDTPENTLKEALECCKNHEMGIEEASLIYGIPKSTLRAKLNDINCSAIDEKYRVFVLTVYPTEAESDLVVYLQNCIASQIVMSVTDTRRLAYELVCEKYKLTDLPQEKNCILGLRWYKKFIEKYSHLDLRHQVLRGDEEKSVDFYNSLEAILTKFDIGHTQVYAVGDVDVKFRVSSTHGEEILHKRTVHTNAKAICCINPCGDFIPPVFIRLQRFNSLHDLGPGLDFTNQKNINKVCDKLKEMSDFQLKNLPTAEDIMEIEKQIKAHLNKKLFPMSEENEEELREKLYDQFIQLKNKINSNSVNSLSDVTCELFYNWFVGFLHRVKPNSQRKILLLLSDSKYVKSFKILELGKMNNVIFLVLPPHSAHKIRPLDGFSMSLNRNVSVCARRWLNKNPHVEVQKIPLEAIFMEAFDETKNPLIAKNGFLYSGICPVNRNIFKSSELGGESVLALNNQKLKISQSCSLNVAGVKRNELSFGIGNESDLKKLCRVCLKEKVYMKPLLETVPSPGPNYHGKKIYEITDVAISFGDGLPPCICQYCLVQLIDAIKVKEMTVDSHNKQLKLREALNRFYFQEHESENHDLMYLFPDATQCNERKISKPTSKNFDMNSICRICMGEKPLMTSIFFRPQGGTLLCSDTCTRIMEISHYQAHIHDGLSSFICPFCRASVYKASEFIRRVLKSDKILREISSNFRSIN